MQLITREVNWVQQVATTIMSDADRSQYEIAANAIISMSKDALGNESRGNSTDGQVVPATQGTMPVRNATTLKNQQELLTQFLTPPARRSQQQRSPSVKKLRKTDKTILTKTHEKKLLAEFAKAKSMERKMNWDALSKRSVFQNNFTPDILRNRGQALLKAHLEEEEHKKRVEATKLSVLKTFIQTTNVSISKPISIKLINSMAVNKETLCTADHCAPTLFDCRSNHLVGKRCFARIRQTTHQNYPAATRLLSREPVDTLSNFWKLHVVGFR